MVDFVPDFSTLLIIVISLVFYKLILQPLVPLLLLKWQFGNKAKLLFYPLFGSYHNYAKSLKEDNDSFAFHRKIIRKEPNTKVILSNLWSKPSLNFLDPNYSKALMMEHDNYQKLKFSSDNRLFEQGIFFQNGKQWKSQRSRLAQFFRFDHLKQRIPMINEVVRQHVAKINQSIENYQILKSNTLITGEILIRSFFDSEMVGLKINGNDAQLELVNVQFVAAQERQQSRLFNFKCMLLGRHAWTFFPTKQQKVIYERTTNLINTIKSLITKRIEIRKNPEYNKTNDFLDCYLQEFENQQKQENTKDTTLITLDEIFCQFISLFTAGTDTTAHVCTLVSYYLAKYPSIQEEILEEFFQVVGQGDMQADQLKLKKFDAFVQECFRMHTPVPALITRQVDKSFYVKDLYVKKGWFVNYSPLAIYENEKYFDKPLEFDHTRWIDNQPIKDKELASFIFAPFSAGPRNCIGQHMSLMETKIIMCHLLRKFRFKLKEGVDYKWNNSFLYLFTPKDIVYIERRN